MYEAYLFEKHDEIAKILDQKTWISSYQLFLQSIKLIDIELDTDDTHFSYDKIIIGGNLRVISDNLRLQELSFAISELDKIRNLTLPKTTVGTIDINKFPKLKKPNARSIPGDFSKNIDMKQNPTEEIFETALNLSSEYEIPFVHRCKIDLEDRLITNSEDIQLVENTLKSQYQISTQFEIYDTNYLITRNASSRSTIFDFKSVVLDIVNSSISRIKHREQSIPENPAVLFHPQALSKLLHDYFNSIGNIPQTNQRWSENLQVYDDPLRSSGFYSTLFDDEGTLTKPLQIVSDGKIERLPTDLISSNWKKGGNGFRVQQYQPLTRSYEYDITPSITNLVLSGGNGRGEMFTDRPGYVLLVRKTSSFSWLGEKNNDFILHINEAELYRNGDNLGPATNFSLRANLDDIMRKGHFSSDQIVSVDPLSIGSIYSGWLIIPPSTVLIR